MKSFLDGLPKHWNFQKICWHTPDRIPVVFVVLLLELLQSIENFEQQSRLGVVGKLDDVGTHGKPIRKMVLHPHIATLPVQSILERKEPPFMLGCHSECFVVGFIQSAIPMATLVHRCHPAVYFAAPGRTRLVPVRLETKADAEECDKPPLEFACKVHKVAVRLQLGRCNQRASEEQSQMCNPFAAFAEGAGQRFQTIIIGAALCKSIVFVVFP